MATAKKKPGTAVQVRVYGVTFEVWRTSRPEWVGFRVMNPKHLPMHSNPSNDTTSIRGEARVK